MKIRSPVLALALFVVFAGYVSLLTRRCPVVAPATQPPTPRPTPCPVAAEPEHHNELEATPAPPVVAAPVVAAAVKPQYSLHVVVFTYKRLAGLKRILKSLAESHYLGHAVALTIFVDFPKRKPTSLEDDGTRAFLRDTFRWPHGPLVVHRRLTNVGLKRSIMEAWYPTRDDEAAAFFEDDIEVSPFWYMWATDALARYAGAGAHASLLGISLFRPIHDELSGRGCVVDNDGRPFALQQPCSWGAVYLPVAWRAFREWYDEYSLLDEDPLVRPARPSSNTWDRHSSWKKYLIKLMADRGWFMVYPNLPGRMVLATNHLMKGEHPTPPRRLFELPLLDVDAAAQHFPAAAGAAAARRRSAGVWATAMPPVGELRAFDVMFKKVASVDALPNAHGRG
jgi:hypothetical protein